MGSSVEKLLDLDNLVPKRDISRREVAYIEENKMFLGQYSGFQRYDSPRYEFAVKLEEKMRNAFWNPNEISLVKDSQSYYEMPEFIQSVMKQIWLFQTLMDSAQNSGMEEIMANITTNPECEAMFKTHGYFELIHSLSYSHILRGIFPDSSSVFDDIKNSDEIKHRVDSEIDGYHRLSKLNEMTDEVEKRKLILEMLVRIYALEGVKFYVSFLVTYVINNNYGNRIQGSTRIIKLINFDEDLHTAVMSSVLNTLRSEQREGFTDLIDSEWFSTMVTDVFTQVYEDEMGWADHLLSYGDIPTLTPGVVSSFLKYYIDNRIGAIGVNKIYNEPKSDVVVWFNQYKDLDLDNTAQQEAEATNYSIGILQDDIPCGKLNI